MARKYYKRQYTYLIIKISSLKEALNLGSDDLSSRKEAEHVIAAERANVLLGSEKSCYLLHSVLS